MVVQVIGSKPGAVILKMVDKVYFANGAGQIINFDEPKRFSIMTGQRVFESNGREIKFVYDSIKNRYFDKFHLIDFKNNGIHQGLLNSILCKFNEIFVISRNNKAELEKNYVSLTSFIFSLIFLNKLSLQFKIRTVMNCLKMNELKLSTGLFCVIYILKEFPHSKVVISGIGFGQSEYWWGKENKLRGHFLNDYAFLKSIPKNHEFWQRVMTTESELTDLFGIKPYFQD